MVVHKRLLVHTINLSVFFTFTVFNSCFKFYMNMNMNVFSAVMDRTTSNDKLMSCPPSLAPFNSDNTSVRHNGQSVVSQWSVSTHSVLRWVGVISDEHEITVECAVNIQW